MPCTTEAGSYHPTEATEEAGEDIPFWTAAFEILQEHNTKNLRDRVISVAKRTLGYDEEKFTTVVHTIETKYDGIRRKLIDEAEINHAYQVALLTAQFLGPDLQHDTLLTALGHDLDENTALSRDDIIALTSQRIYRGIDALSHQTNKHPIYPDAEDKRPYFADLLQAHRQDPELGILTIKVMDQIAVSSGPLVKSELKSPELVHDWRSKNLKKLSEMHLLSSMLGPGEENEKRVLKQGISSVRIRRIPGIGMRAAKRILSNLPARK
ncbi:MAG TPA: hypothetical protein VND99_03845 [Candidatus Acidoferrales bacterium]|nr:hypothetical protein [Candidatus Acidoferrales bacterium]